MYQLYFRCEFFKNTTTFATLGLLLAQVGTLFSFMDELDWFYVEIIDPQGTLIQKVAKNYG